MMKFHSIKIKGGKNKIASVVFHPKPKGIIQFIGAFVFGSFPECPYKYLFQHLYDKDYSIIVYRFPFQPLNFCHLPVAIKLLSDLYHVRIEIIKKLFCNEVTDQLEFYANDANYFWLGHSLGCKYILLLEILSYDDSKPKDAERRDEVLRSCLREKYLSHINKDITETDKTRQVVVDEITKLLKKPYPLSPFIRDQPSLLLAPEISNTVQIFNIPIRPSSGLGFPNRHETKRLIEHSTELFNLIGLISFNLDGIARDDVDFLECQLRTRKFRHFLHKVFLGWHFEPQGIYIENLVSCMDLILQELRQRQRQGIAHPVQCEDELSCSEVL